MKVWLDILTPKQLLYFTSIAGMLRKAGHSVLLTSRKYDELDGLVREFFPGWEIKTLGRFGGYTLEDKLRASVERLGLLLDSLPVREIDLAASSGSVEAARISYGLKIPHVLASDSPHSPVNPLTAPLSRLVITPWIIGRREWTKYGVRPPSVRRYRAIDPYFWLRDFKPDRSVLEKLGMDSGYVLLRLPESAASYLMLDDREYVKPLAKLLDVVRSRGLKLLVMSRYGEQRDVAERLLGGADTTIVDLPVIGAHLIYYSEVFVGGGGTMTQEAALLGKPCISIYPGEQPTVLRYLSRIGLVRHCRKIEESVTVLGRILRDVDRFSGEARERSRRLWRAMRDPEREIVEWLEEAAST